MRTLEEQNPIAARGISGAGAQATEKRVNGPFVVGQVNIV